MTVTYTLEISHVRFINLVKLLARWKGSVYKLMYKELCMFLLGYYCIGFIYRYLLDDLGKRKFEAFSIYCREFLSIVPITFILGFYLSFVANRWWSQYLSIPWPDKLAIEISAYVQGVDERGRIIRRSLVRYLNLISCLTFQYTSTVIKKRFPTLDHLVSSGIMTQEERIALEATPTPHGLWWIPAQWFGQLVMTARKEGRIHDDLHVKTLIDSLCEYRAWAGGVWSYDWISVPLAYTQVVTAAVYSFFVACLFGRQYLYIHSSSAVDSAGDVDLYFPIFTVFQFLFYVGWLKVAESMICPFGEDDDDFNLNWIIDRNIQVAYLIVDQMHRNSPKPSKDHFWHEVDAEIPYTYGSSAFKSEPFFGSTTAMDISAKQSEWMPEQQQMQMPPIDEEAAIGFPIKSPSRKKHKQKLREANINSLDSTKDDHEVHVNESDGSLHSNVEDDASTDADQQSNSSIQYEEEKNRRGRLTGLLMGVSRQTLGSRFGSKGSLNSRLSRKRSSTSKFSFQRSPPSSLIRPKSIPNSRQQLNRIKKSRGSSPIIAHPRDGISDEVLSENNKTTIKGHATINQFTEKASNESSQVNSIGQRRASITEESKTVDPDGKTVEISRPLSLDFRNRSDPGHPNEEQHKMDCTSRTPLIPVEEEKNI